MLPDYDVEFKKVKASRSCRKSILLWPYMASFKVILALRAHSFCYTIAVVICAHYYIR